MTQKLLLNLPANETTELRAALREMDERTAREPAPLADVKDARAARGVRLTRHGWPVVFVPGGQ